jgi:regulator of protease activity HflC (stomatin/prohibitin superfamily)
MFKEDRYGDKTLSGIGWFVVIVGIIVALAGVLTLFSAATTVKYGTVKVVTRFGGLTGRYFEPGLHWKAPFVEGTVKIPTIVQSYETSDQPDQSQADFTDYPVTAQTIDGQQVSVKYTVIFRIPPDKAVSITQDVGGVKQVVENIVKAHSRNLVRLHAQNFEAEGLYSGEGIFAYQKEVMAAMDGEFARYGIVLDDFLVRKIDFDPDYVTAIEQQQIAQEGIETARYQADAAEWEKEKTIRQAEADKQREILLAEADAEKKRLNADAEAYNIETQGQALRRYPEVIQLRFVDNLDGVTWGIMPDSGLTPLLPVPATGD